MSTVGTHRSPTAPWLASAAVAGIIGASAIVGAALQQPAGEAFPHAPGARAAETYRLQTYPHLSHGWRIHHALSKSNAGHSPRE